MISNTLTTAPAVEPVTADELDKYLRGDGVLASSDSDLLETFISAARQYVEEFTRLALVTQTWTMYLDAWPGNQTDLGWWDGVREGSLTQGQKGSIELPISPLQSVTSIKTFDQSNNETTFDSSNYFLNTSKKPGEVILNSGATWPVFARSRNGIEIIYVVGFGDAATDVPAPLKLAVKMLAAHWYENREFTKTQSDMNQAASPLHVQSILNRYKVMRL